MSDKIQVVFVLDLSVENTISDDGIIDLLPKCRSRHIYRLTDVGAIPDYRGSHSRRWREWCAAVDKMRARARRDVGDNNDIHYYVMGRAGLPIGVYVGHHLSRWAQVTVINRREDLSWDYIPLYGTPPQGQERYFNIVRGLDEVSHAPRMGPHGKIVVFISNRFECNHDEIRRFVEGEERGCHVAGIVEVIARREEGIEHTKWLNSDNAAKANAELTEIFHGLKSAYQRQDGLIMLVGGPLPLAIMAGRAVNPNVYNVVWVPNFVQGRYVPAVEMPWGRGRAVTALILTANPSDGNHINVQGELRTIQQEINHMPEGTQFELDIAPAVQVGDLPVHMEKKPQILHFAGHGATQATYFVRDDGTSHLVPARGFIDLLRATNEQSLRLVILNSCESCQQAEALTEFVDFAIGTSAPLADQAGIEFSRMFYRSLVQGRSVNDSFERARAMLNAYDPQDAEIVKLYWRDGIDPDREHLVDPGGGQHWQ